MITTELRKKIYKEVKKAYLKKDGTPFKRYKCFWIKTLTDIVAKNLSLNKEVVKKGISELSNHFFLIRDHMNTIHYFPKYEEHIREVNERLKTIGRMAYSTESVYIETWKKNGIMYKYIDGFEAYRSKK